MKKRTVTMFTDGSCLGNPGPGGWAAVLRYGVHEKHLSGAAENTTNNRMELQAVIEGLAALNRPMEVDIYTDSQYVMKGMTEWLAGWQRRHWKSVKNVDLWQRLIESSARHTLNWHWVKGHSGHALNELADDLARAAALSLQKTLA